MVIAFHSTKIMPPPPVGAYENDPTDQSVSQVLKALKPLEDAAATTKDVDRLNQLRHRAKVIKDAAEDLFQFVADCEARASKEK